MTISLVRTGRITGDLAKAMMLAGEIIAHVRAYPEVKSATAHAGIGGPMGQFMFHIVVDSMSDAEALLVRAVSDPAYLAKLQRARDEHLFDPLTFNDVLYRQIG
ncbi:MAG: hypothetical protein ACOYKM_03885 [Caulobacterales bacterium]|jgi:hypothetical protein